VSFYPDAVEVGIYGSKTDRPRTGQTAPLPPASDDAGGAAALIEVVLHCLRRLTALDPATLATLVSRLAASFPQAQPRPSAMATWPEEIQAGPWHGPSTSVASSSIVYRISVPGPGDP
jgi:hypothetical protein